MTKEQCECTIDEDASQNYETKTWRNDSQIIYCPLHAAAPELLAACKFALHYCGAVQGGGGPIEYELKQAISKAERG